MSANLDLRLELHAHWRRPCGHEEDAHVARRLAEHRTAIAEPVAFRDILQGGGSPGWAAGASMLDLDAVAQLVNRNIAGFAEHDRVVVDAVAIEADAAHSVVVEVLHTAAADADASAATQAIKAYRFADLWREGERDIRDALGQRVAQHLPRQRVSQPASQIEIERATVLAFQ